MARHLKFGRNIKAKLNDLAALLLVTLDNIWKTRNVAKHGHSLVDNLSVLLSIKTKSRYYSRTWCMDNPCDIIRIRDPSHFI